MDMKSGVGVVQLADYSFPKLHQFAKLSNKQTSDENEEDPTTGETYKYGDG